MAVDKNYDIGCRLPADDWLWLNGRAIFDFTHWAKWFHVAEIRRGAIHDFQDIVVLRPRK